MFSQATSQRFKPDRLPSFCLCRMPVRFYFLMKIAKNLLFDFTKLFCICCLQYNPDLEMVVCSNCKLHFHRRCMEIIGRLAPGSDGEKFDCKQCTQGSNK